MTWNELAEEIAKMPPTKRDEPVRVVEPYDEAEVYSDLTLFEAEEGDWNNPDGVPPHSYYLA